MGWICYLLSCIQDLLKVTPVQQTFFLNAFGSFRLAKISFMIRILRLWNCNSSRDRFGRVLDHSFKINVSCESLLKFKLIPVIGKSPSNRIWIFVTPKGQGFYFLMSNPKASLRAHLYVKYWRSELRCVHSRSGFSFTFRHARRSNSPSFFK